MVYLFYHRHIFLKVLIGILTFLFIYQQYKMTDIETTVMTTRMNKVIVLIANYRDSKRCGETLASIFDNALHPDQVRIGLHDQLMPNETTCFYNFCLNRTNCRRSQIRGTKIDAREAKGPTVARYMAEEMIDDEDFCMSIDSHLQFVKHWDKRVIDQWSSLHNEYSVLTVYPKNTDAGRDEKMVHHMCNSKIETTEEDAMISYNAAIGISPGAKPRLSSQLAGGFNFGNCRQALDVRNDPYTPFLFHGEEYSRAARLWTHGYDLYSPNEDIVFHWYEKRKYMWDEDWGRKYFIKVHSQRRLRTMLGLPVSKNDSDLTHINRFSLGNKRTFDQWKNFSRIDPLAKFNASKPDQFSNCGDLVYVPYNTSLSQKVIE